MLHLHEAVQMDLKKLLRNPPVVKMPRKRDLISSHPLFGALPPTLRRTLESSTKEIMEPRGRTLYREGAIPSGFWLISNGVVKWTDKNARNRHSLHPVITHGSTLGLYEVLSEKPYICDVITDSVALCFFVETDKKMLSLLRSGLEIEEFLWQESVIVLAKVLLPQMFETLAMRDIRALINRSRMIMYIREETIVIPHHCVGFLLEGYIRNCSIQEQLITSPAALLPSSASHSFQRLNTSGPSASSSSFQGSRYQADSRARVVIFDMAAVEIENDLKRRPSSFLLRSSDHLPVSLSREHGGLMSWPELFYKQKQPNPNSKSTDNHANLSTKAMQLSLFGSMVDDQWRARRVPRSIEVSSSHSMSYPRFQPRTGRSLVSVRSEGAATVRKNLVVTNFDEENPAQSIATYRSLVADDTSDESGGEDENIIRVDSPSTLSFL